MTEVKSDDVTNASRTVALMGGMGRLGVGALSSISKLFFLMLDISYVPDYGLVYFCQMFVGRW